MFSGYMNTLGTDGLVVVFKNIGYSIVWGGGV